MITLMVGVAALMGFSTGCSDDESTVDVGPESSKITVTELIFNPKSPAPGDTMRASAVVTASTANIGDFVKYAWSGTGGTFIETNKSSVRWVAPTSSGVFNLSCKASNSVNSSTGSDEIFVGELQDFITEKAGELHPRTADDNLYYLSPPAHADSGVIVRKKNMTTGEDEVVFPDEMVAGTQYRFDAGAMNAAHMVAEGAFRPFLNVVHDDLVSETQTVIARDQRPFPYRPNEFTSPYVSLDGLGITYQGSLLDQTAPPSQGGVDTFTLYIYDLPAETTQRCTFIGDNFYPSLSSDNRHLVFVSDRDGTFKWEYYALPVDAMVATPDTVQDAVVKLTTSGGLFGSETVPPSPRPFVWNPTAAFPVMAVIANNDKLWMVAADGSGDVLVDIAGKIGNMSWSTDGRDLAVASFDGDTGLGSINLVSPSGNPLLLHQGELRDRLGALNWSPDNQFLIYSVDRSGTVWYEMIDVDGSTSLTKPVRITPAWLPGGAADYGLPLMSLRSSWQPNTVNAYLFFLDEDTPRVKSLDISGLSP